MHPMYKKQDGTDLWQGDIIDREALVRHGALRGHQDYIESRGDFVAFCVVTQTCDLVRERDRCVDFICLAVIRRLVDVFSAEAATGGRRSKTRSSLEKIINHRENKEGYFYLHAEPGVIDADGAVVDLRTTFSLYAKKHYDQIYRSRVLSLDDVYANKLGWMAGHLFSRVPNLEWDDLKQEGGETAEQYVGRMLDEIKNGGRKKHEYEEPVWPTLDAIVKDPEILRTLDDRSLRSVHEQAKTLHQALEKHRPHGNPR
jgi:hypothetical protein